MSIHDHMNYEKTDFMDMVQINFALIATMVLLLYMVAAIASKHRFQKLDRFRMVLFILGVICSTSSVVGPITVKAHNDFTYHMIGHLLLGMLGPLLIALGAPMTIVLRALPVSVARRLTSILKRRPIQFVNHPFVVSTLNIGGLWVLYTTPLYGLMHEKPLIHLLVHIHVFLAGYLFTLSIIYSDINPHRYSFRFRTIVLGFAIAGHSILAKYLYANPPVGVSATDTEKGAMLMYYGGDAVDLILIIILFYQWYKASRPRILKQDGTIEVE